MIRRADKRSKHRRRLNTRARSIATELATTHRARCLNEEARWSKQTRYVVPDIEEVAFRNQARNVLKTEDLSLYGKPGLGGRSRRGSARTCSGMRRAGEFRNPRREKEAAIQETAPTSIGVLFDRTPCTTNIPDGNDLSQSQNALGNAVRFARKMSSPGI